MIAIRESYEELTDAFIESIYGDESTLSREEWVMLVYEKEAWITDPQEIREKVGFNVV
jgi:hypothetical protein